MAYLLATSMITTPLTPQLGATIVAEAATRLSVLNTAGDMENAAITWQKSEADGYNVYYKTSDGTYTQVDNELIRTYGETMRVDIPGLAAGTYEVCIVPLKEGQPKKDASISTTSPISPDLISTIK